MSGRHRRPPAEVPARRPGRLLTIVGLVAVVIVVVALAVVLPIVLSGGGHSSSTLRTTSSPTPTTAGPAPSTTTSAGASSPASPTPSPAASSRSSAPPAAPPPTLLVRADRGVSWLTVYNAHGRKLYDGLLRKGKQASFDQGYVWVVVGDAGQVVIETNGVARRRGSVGQVLQFGVHRRA